MTNNELFFNNRIVAIAFLIVLNRCIQHGGLFFIIISNKLYVNSLNLKLI